MTRKSRSITSARDTRHRSDGRSEQLEVAAALVRTGHKLLKPLSAAMRYDIAIDNGDGTVVRIQCKTGTLRDGRIVFRVFRVCSRDARRPGGVPYQGCVDAFGVFCPTTATCYLVPIAAVADCRTMGVLRIRPPRNNQQRGIRLASDFEIREGR